METQQWKSSAKLSLRGQAFALFSELKQLERLASRDPKEEGEWGEPRACALPILFTACICSTRTTSLSTFYHLFSNTVSDTSFLSLKLPYHLSIDPVLYVSPRRHFQFSVSSQAAHKPFLWRSYFASLHLQCCHKSTVKQRKEWKQQLVTIAASDSSNLRICRTHWQIVTNNVFLSIVKNLVGYWNSFFFKCHLFCCGILKTT